MDDQAQALAAAWGLLSSDNNNSNNNNHISGDSAASDNEAVSIAKQFGAADNGGGGGRAERGVGGRREDWTPLWEAMAMLSVPSVSVGAVGAGERPGLCWFCLPGVRCCLKVALSSLVFDRCGPRCQA